MKSYGSSLKSFLLFIYLCVYLLLDKSNIKYPTINNWKSKLTLGQLAGKQLQNFMEYI